MEAEEQAAILNEIEVEYTKENDKVVTQKKSLAD
jgi:hypothetical protein